jgi:predicted HAD superfamily Cof-like phosphohydrolase
MVNLSIEETSGVDHPAHLHEGWLVMKAADSDDVRKAMQSNQEAPMDNEMNVEDVLKEAPDAVRKMYEDMQKATDEAVAKAAEAVAKAAEAEDTLRKERDERADSDAIVKARESYQSLGIDPEQVGPALRRLSETDADLAKAIETALVSANAKVESADIFSEIGKSALPSSGSAYEQADVMAKAAFAAGHSATIEQALTDVFTSNPDLYSQYLSDQGK